MLQFDFGQNWLEFSRQALTPEKIIQAKQDFAGLLQGVTIAGRYFLDIGFGQGLGILTATEMGGKTVGNDINPKCFEALKQNRKFFSNTRIDDIPIIIGSILDQSVKQKLLDQTPDRQGFDIVHSWGVLHHTGKMWTAIENASILVKPGGVFVLAIYNKHWTAPVWHKIKYVYNKSPEAIKRMMLYSIGSIQFFGAWATMGENPAKKERGMDFWYDQRDWLGGFPYEYASKDEIVRFLQKYGFELLRIIPQKGWTGNIEYVFKKQC